MYLYIYVRYTLAEDTRVGVYGVIELDADRCTETTFRQRYKTA